MTSARKDMLRRKPGCKGFTLLELLVVIAILGLLMGLLFPGIQAVKEGMRKKRAKLTTMAIVQAMREYRTVFGQWPLQDDDRADKIYMDAAELKQLFYALTNNARQKVFIEIPPGSEEDGVYNDPWNRPYMVIVDWTGDFICTVDCITNIHGVSVGAFSHGRSPGDPKTRISSWE